MSLAAVAAQYATTLPLGAGPAMAAAAAANLQPTPAAVPRDPQQGAAIGAAFQALAPAHLQQLQHQPTAERPQSAAAQPSLAAQAQLSLPFGPSLFPLGPAPTYPSGAAPMPVFNLAGAAASMAAAQQPQQQVYAMAPAADAGSGADSAATDFLYVNPRQLAGILRRRKQREKEEAKRRGLPKSSRKKRAVPKDRPRRPNGTFMSKDELDAMEDRQRELADVADARFEREAATTASQNESEEHQGVASAAAPLQGPRKGSPEGGQRQRRKPQAQRSDAC